MVTDPSMLEGAIRRFRKYFTENISRELRLREGFIDRKKVKRAYALRRLRRRQRKERMFNG